MKLRTNRKYYNFTHRQKQRAKSDRNAHLYSIGGAFRTERERAFRAKCRRVLRWLIAGRDVEFPLYRKTNKWDCW